MHKSIRRSVPRGDGEAGTVEFSEQLIPGRIYDVMETYVGKWFFASGITEHLPDEKPSSIQRALDRLVLRGAFETRIENNKRIYRVPTRTYL